MNRPVPYNKLRHELTDIVSGIRLASTLLKEPPIDVSGTQELLGMLLTKLSATTDEMDSPAGKLIGSYTLESGGDNASGRLDYTLDGTVAIALKTGSERVLLIGTLGFESNGSVVLTITESNDFALIGRRIEGECHLRNGLLTFNYFNGDKRETWVWKKL